MKQPKILSLSIRNIKRMLCYVFVVILLVFILTSFSLSNLDTGITFAFVFAWVSSFIIEHFIN